MQLRRQTNSQHPLTSVKKKNQGVLKSGRNSAFEKVPEYAKGQEDIFD